MFTRTYEVGVADDENAGGVDDPRFCRAARAVAFPSLAWLTN